MKFLALLIIPVAFLTMPLPCWPDSHIQSRQQKLIQPYSVQIANSSISDRVYFSICGSNCSPPLNTHLLPDHYDVFTCDGSTTFDFVIITAMRDGSEVTRKYTLEHTKRYEIFADAEGVWDIREIVSRR